MTGAGGTQQHLHHSCCKCDHIPCRCDIIVHGGWSGQRTGLAQVVLRDYSVLSLLMGTRRAVTNAADAVCVFVSK